ncbi:putative sporulation protein YtxC [Metabacillus arenae]|uniref:Sporulation protein YtxC n=1 Tax=Metabacillus arenae TaxID=2771434 RepID=A0A926RWY8_9BACI|nr:putative sporulation protein YtxC [Metabacillus arenae]MBD1380075.1 putative sporulation protein YtxC [Metabacillus arenae]
MVEITFNCEQDLECLYRFLQQHRKGNTFHLELIESCGVRVSSAKQADSFISTLTALLMEYWLTYKEDGYLIAIIEKQFFFTDKDEKQELLHIAHSLMEGERTEIPKVEELGPRQELLQKAFELLLKPGLSFTFDSFSTFRLQAYFHRLREYVEIAIEEYKLEQEYQNFIQSLREYVIQHESKITTLYIDHDEHFFVFDDQLNLLSQKKLKSFIDRTFIYQHPMYIDSGLLAPLVSIAPEHIYLYTDDNDNGMIQTIQNIFQERLRVFSRDSFQLKRIK